MKRRTFVAGTGIAFSLPIAGCLDEVSTSRASDGNDNTPGDTNEQNDDSGGQPTDDNSYTYDETRHDSIFIENTIETEIVVEVIVERKSDRNVLIENVYAVPPETGIEIPDIAKVGNEYAITAKFEKKVDTFDWTVLTCAHEEGPEVGGETALGVEIIDDEPRILHTGCDESGAGDNRDLTYENHEKYAKDD
ncbi:hypothetical protein [Natronosalvus halobius]|uniref:hypothetical protein n=1 Tax=Natronosalvus halobius TaxID=2953746 RepID=UPI00209D9FD1|nr:hypothetical protein [Natronosalvus halobius]USZ72122.1 hypothetical protein NGM15_02070 [Natronosalvus halobius]